MARPLRIDVEDGWYHVCARGIDRRDIYCVDHEREHFLELLEKLAERYRIVIHAYSLMSNHYHLICQTPDANLSAGMQWLTTSYSMWFNRRNNRVGPLFQGRYKSLPIENSAWAYSCSLYVHLNPVVRSEFGLDPWSKKAESQGLKAPSEEMAAKRIGELRSYKWSSYRAYAGYRGTPDWLTTKDILSRASRKVDDRVRTYRGDAEAKLTKGVAVNWPLLGRLKEGVALGSTEYLKKIKMKAKGCSREISGKMKLRRRFEFEDVLKVVEDVLGKSSDEFMSEHGGQGKPLVLWAAREYCGMTLREIGDCLGGTHYAAVSGAIRRFEEKGEKSRQTKKVMKDVQEILNVQT
jgi:REP element-mobilizing transposase RayT